MVSPEVVILAIKAGLQLYGAIRKAYVDATRGRVLVLPLPRSQGILWDSADSWFTGDGRSEAAKYPRIQELLAIAEPTAQDKDELVELYRAVLSIAQPEDVENDATRGLLAENDLIALLTVRQWENGRYGPNPTALQRVGGTLVNIAIDYFLEQPGALSDKRPEGRALRSFLVSLDKTDFATVAVADIAPDLLIAVLDSGAANPDLVSGGEKEQLLVKNVTESLLGSARELLADASATERAEASVWIQLVARALIKGGAETVLANPQRFLGVGEDEAALISHVGNVITALVVGNERVTFRALLSTDGMNKVVTAVLKAVAANPDLLKLGHEGVHKVLVAVAGELAKLPEPLSPDAFPELIRLLLSKSAENMDLLWGREFSSPEQHLLVTATKVLVAELARRSPTRSTWKPIFTPSQLVMVAEAVMDEIVEQPQWLIAHAGSPDTQLAVALRAMLEALSTLPGDRVSAEAGVAILKAGLGAVALNVTFLKDLSPSGAAATRVAITAVLEAIFDTIFGDSMSAEAQWRLARNTTLTQLVEVGLTELADYKVDEAHINALRQVVAAELQNHRRFRTEQFTTDLRNHLAEA